MKALGMLVAAVAGAVGFAALEARGSAPTDVYLTLTLQVDPVAQTWQAFGQITGDTTQTSGLAGVEIDVTGAGGLQIGTNGVDTTNNDMPVGGVIGSLLVGFYQFSSPGTFGAGITGSQYTYVYQTRGGQSNVLTGVGTVAQTQSGVTWGLPVLLADGTFTGTSGSLTIAGSPTVTTFLPAVLPPPNTGGGIRTFSPVAVYTQTVQIPDTNITSRGIVPEYINRSGADFEWNGSPTNAWDTLVTASWLKLPLYDLIPTGWSNNANRTTPSGASFFPGTPTTVTVNGNIDVCTIDFGTRGWTLASGTGVLAYGATGVMFIETDNPGTVPSDTINAAIVDGSTFGSGGGVTSLDKGGTGTLLLGGANTYSGTTTVLAGTLQMGAVGTLPKTTDLTVWATLDLNGFSQQVHSLSDGGGIAATVTNSSAGAATLTVSSPDPTTSTRFAGVISGKLGLTLSGRGTLALTGANTYSGMTSVDGGATLALDSTGALPANGAVVNNGTLIVNADTITGSLTGSGTTIVAPGVVLVTDFSQGSLVNNGTVFVDGPPSIGSTSGSGTLLFASRAGNVLTITSPNASSGSVTINSGTLVVANATGSATGSGNVTLNGGTLGGYGTIAGAVIDGGGASMIYPSVTLPATSAGTLTVGGLTTSAFTTLNFNLVTPGASHAGAGSVNDIVNVAGNNGLTFNGGTVQFTSHSTGAASLGYYRIMEYSGAIGGGGVSSLDLPAIADNIAYTLDTTRDPGFIDVHRGLLGDANDDGVANFADFVVLSNNFGVTNAGWSGGDFNGDGVVDSTDFVTLSNSLGATIGANEAAGVAGAASGVPEPASLVLLGMGLLGMCRRRGPCRRGCALL